jgi:methyl-accepting chemotaxis protein
VYSNVVIKEKRQQEVENAQKIIIKMDQLALGLSMMLRSARGEVLVPQEKNYQDYQKITEQGILIVQKVSPELETLIQDPRQKEQLDTMIEKSNTFTKGIKQVFDLVKAGQINQAIKLTDELRLSEIDKLHDQIVAQEIGILTKKQSEDKAAGSFLILVVIFGTLISIIATLISSLWIALGINRKLHDSASEITASSSQIAVAIEQQEGVTRQQAASVHETTTTMDELEASFRQSAEQAKAAVAAAQKVLHLAENGTNAVEENLEGMFTLENKVEAIADQMVNLSEQANQIGIISQFVSELASQTDILAINSAVEAVRAGEHGKGFSIVANEIRRLADQSQRSAEKISTLVSQIQNATSSTVMVTDEGTKTVKTVVQIAHKIEQAFTGVEESVNEVVLNNQQISLNLKQQLDGIQQVVQAMDAINKGARETAIGIGQTRIGTQQLNRAAIELKQMV